jgi:hypothetical protein
MGKFFINLGKRIIRFQHRMKCRWNSFVVRLTIKCPMDNCKCYEE